MNKRKVLLAIFSLAFISFLLYLFLIQYKLNSINTENDIYSSPLITKILKSISKDFIEKQLDITFPGDAEIASLSFNEDNSTYIGWYSENTSERFIVGFFDITNIASIKDILFVHAQNVNPQSYTYELVNSATNYFSQMIGEIIPQDTPVTMNISKRMEGEENQLSLQLSWTLSNNNNGYCDTLNAVYYSRECNLEDFELFSLDVSFASERLNKSDFDVNGQIGNMLIIAKNFVSYVENWSYTYTGYEYIGDRVIFRFKICEKGSFYPRNVKVTMDDTRILYYVRTNEPF